MRTASRDRPFGRRSAIYQVTFWQFVPAPFNAHVEKKDWPSWIMSLRICDVRSKTTNKLKADDQPEGILWRNAIGVCLPWRFAA